MAEFCKSLGLIEKYGSGIKRIVNYIVAACLPVPAFRNISDGFMVTIFSGEKVGEKVGERVTSNQEKIIALMRTQPGISTAAISDAIGISKRKTEENIRKLREAGLVRRIGPAKGGYWEVARER